MHKGGGVIAGFYGTIFGIAVLRTKFSPFAKSVRDGRAGHGTGSFFLVDSSDFSRLYIVYGATHPRFVRL